MKKLALVLSLVLVVFALAACSSSTPKETEPKTDAPAAQEPAENKEEPAALELNDGTFKGIGKGFKGDIEVEVVIEEGKITTINILSQNESEGIAEPALEEVPAAIIEAQSTEVDAASGATGTSKGVIAAVEAALAEAQK